METRWIQLAADLARAATSPEALQNAIAALSPPAEMAPLLDALRDIAARAMEMETLANTDELTGLLNRRAFYAQANAIVSRETLPGSRATLLLCDLDNFKTYNDAYGHARGDEILHSIATLLTQTTRRHDLLARIGGDEFAVLFWDDAPREASSSPLDSFETLAERFRHAVELSDLPALGTSGEGHLTISGGLAKFPEDGTTVQSLLAAADKALREAKTAGKNSILLISNPTEAS